MRRRIGFAGVAVAAVSLIVGVAMAPAASHKKHHRPTPAPAPVAPKPTTVLLRCSASPTTVPPAGQANVDQPPSEGTQYGPVTCTSPSSAGTGVMADQFTVPDSGDMIGIIALYFKTGTIEGSFDLAPGEGQPITPDTFASQDWSGSIAVKGGTGIYQGVTGKDSKGTMACTTPDSVHMTCTWNVMIVIPPAGSSTGTGAAKHG